MVKHRKEYSELFDYLSANDSSDQETGLVVFGRKDPLVARKVLDLVQDNRASWAVITGGVGKDSGDLKVPEAEYLAQTAEKEAAERGLELPPLHLETQASNGGENARNSLDVIRRAKLEYPVGMTAVAHATSSRRLAEMLKHAAHQKGEPFAVYREASDYKFDPENPDDQAEARAEILRLANWPAKEWLLPQEDLPENLVDFAKDIESKKS